jgi:hypothetical protein
MKVSCIMETKASQNLNLRKSIIAVLLAALMVVGLSFYGFNVANADPTVPADPVSTVPNDGPDVINPQGYYALPAGGLFTFVGTGFEPNVGIEVTLESRPGVLKTFVTDENGTIIDPDNPERTDVVIPRENAQLGLDHLLFSYTTSGIERVTVFDRWIFVTWNPYDAIITGSTDAGASTITVVSEEFWAPGNTVYVKVDYSEAVYGSFPVDENGAFDIGDLELTGDLVPLYGEHTITLLAPAYYNFPPASVSEVIDFGSGS